MPLPTFFIIGAPKAGTTSLHHYLAQHPQVQMSEPKEPRFFAGPENGLPYPPDKVETAAEYEALFDAAAPVRGESSTDYAFHPRRAGVPARIRETVPEARFVYMVRDPVARSVSHYKMAAALLGERRSLSDALREDLAEPRSRLIAPSLYATQLELYHQSFDPERILVVDQDDLRRRRQETLAEIFAFLDLDPAAAPDLAGEEEMLQSERWRRHPGGYARFVGEVISPRVRWIPPGLRRSVRSGIERVAWRPIDDQLDDAVRARLEQRYRPEVARLRELTGKPFASWSV
jgi:hypothetical protein